MIIPLGASTALANRSLQLLFATAKDLDGDVIHTAGLPGAVGVLLDDDLDKLTESWSSIIGVVTAIVGNILISIALNTQRYAHTRQAREWKEEKEKEQQQQQQQQQHSRDESYHDRGLAGTGINEHGKKKRRRSARYEIGNENGRVGNGTTETEHEENDEDSEAKARRQYRPASNGSRQHYSSSALELSREEDYHESDPLLLPSQLRTSTEGQSDDEDDDAITRKNSGKIDDSNYGSNINNNGSEDESSSSSRDSGEPNEKNYLRSPYWWLGMVLMVVGEGGNFLAYGFAPASIVSPLGVVALISNCIIAPFMLKEPFRKRDFFGVVVAIAGAVTVVLSANNSNPKLGPDDIWHRIKTWEFETYLAVTLTLILILTFASNRYGEKSILIDLGLAGLIGTFETRKVSEMRMRSQWKLIMITGGYTVLSTKGVASLLSYTLWRALTFPVTYLFIAILAGSAVMQIKHVNRALQRFDSTRVIPTQFVLFTLSVILGSAILYRDFERTSGQSAAKFVGGCTLTFVGVYLLTTGDRSQEDSVSEFKNAGSQKEEDEEEQEEEQDDDVLQPVEEEQDSPHSIPKSHGRRSGTAKDRLSRLVSTGQLNSRSRPKAQRILASSSSPPSSSQRISLLKSQEARVNSQPRLANEKKPQQPPPERSDAGTSDPSNAPASRVKRFTGPSSSGIADRASIPSAAAEGATAATVQPPPILKTAISTPIMPTNTTVNRDGQDVSRPVTPSAQPGVSTSPDQAKKLSRRSVAGIAPGPLTSPLSSPLSVLVADSRRRGIELESPRRLQRPVGPSRLAATTYYQSRDPVIGELSTDDRHGTFSQADESFADGATFPPRE